ncbi:hypothetical protein ALC53_08909 [Atta colombica]|uniref:Uncharacterized protein n=1 Tax=Atta colombica TaxID=520822 RepID=A0A195B936_9HYME|nr:hypothetical protein ALC53_08909 [Atta colombica]
MVPVPLFRLRSRIADRCTSSSTSSEERARLVTYLMLRFTPSYFPSTITSATLWICRCDNKASGCSSKRVRDEMRNKKTSKKKQPRRRRRRRRRHLLLQSSFVAIALAARSHERSALIYATGPGGASPSLTDVHVVPRGYYWVNLVGDTGCWLLVRHTGRAAINW